MHTSLYMPSVNFMHNEEVQNNDKPFQFQQAAGIVVVVRLPVASFIGRGFRADTAAREIAFFKGTVIRPW